MFWNFFVPRPELFIFSVASTWYFCRNIHIFFDALHDSKKSVDSKLFQINKLPTRHVFGFDCRFVAAKKFKKHFFRLSMQKSTFAILQNFSAKQSTFVTEIFQLCLWNCRRSHYSHHMMQQQKSTAENHNNLCQHTHVISEFQSTIERTSHHHLTEWRISSRECNAAFISNTLCLIDIN